MYQSAINNIFHNFYKVNVVYNLHIFCCILCVQVIEDLDLNVQGFFKYGKGFIKTCKVCNG